MGNTTPLQQSAAGVSIGQSGQFGTIAVFPTDDNKIVTSTDMKVGAYTIAAQPTAPCLISLLSTPVGTADTMGTVTIVGTDINGDALTEVLTPISGTTVYTTSMFASVTSATGAGWVIVSSW